MNITIILISHISRIIVLLILIIGMAPLPRRAAARLLCGLRGAGQRSVHRDSLVGTLCS